MQTSAAELDCVKAYVPVRTRTASNSRRNVKLLAIETAVKMPLIMRLSATETMIPNSGKIAI